VNVVILGSEIVTFTSRMIFGRQQEADIPVAHIRLGGMMRVVLHAPVGR